MDGAIVGLNLADCLARPSAAEPAEPAAGLDPVGLDPGGEALEYLLLAGEAGALAAMQRPESDQQRRG
jgi:hypothetical protein